MNIINANVNFGKKKTVVSNVTPLTVNDYNSTKIVFEFDRADGMKVFEMSNPKGELVFLSEIVDNEIVLGGVTEDGLPGSIFATPGQYKFEVSLYLDNSKLTSGIGTLPVEAEGINIDDDTIKAYCPLIDELILDVATEQYVDTKIESAINDTLGGSY